MPRSVLTPTSYYDHGVSAIEEELSWKLMTESEYHCDRPDHAVLWRDVEDVCFNTESRA